VTTHVHIHNNYIRWNQ